jgi:hypothetical protein
MEKIVEDYIFENLRKGEKSLLGRKVIKKEGRDIICVKI